MADAWGLVAVMVEIGVNAMTDVTTGLSTPSVTSTFRSAMGGPGWWNARLLASVMSLGLGVAFLHGRAWWGRSGHRSSLAGFPAMPHKANAARRHHTPRPKRRVLNGAG